MAPTSRVERVKPFPWPRSPAQPVQLRFSCLIAQASLFPQAQPHGLPFCFSSAMLLPSTGLWPCCALCLKYPTPFILVAYSTPSCRITFPGRPSFTPQVNEGALFLTLSTASCFPGFSLQSHIHHCGHLDTTHLPPSTVSPGRAGRWLLANHCSSDYT